jgi:hypothetical protein
MSPELFRIDFLVLGERETAPVRRIDDATRLNPACYPTLEIAAPESTQ